jgi:protein-S-isoprenylcysteine O-methyltransferase Ste14
MELFPRPGIGWLNGWIPLAVLYLVFGIVLLLLPKDVVARLYDRSRWSRRQKVISAAGKLLAVAVLVLVILTPLKVGRGVLVVGMVLYILGLAGFIVALINFRDAPADQPATLGLYGLSRNPQQVSLLLASLGMALMIGSWFVVLFLLVGTVSTHRRFLAEERACLAQYGESYQRYMEQVPRYFKLF